MKHLDKITLIDDDQVCHLISTKIINMFSSFAVESFTDAREALKEIRWRASDQEKKVSEFILLDIDMPEMNGWQFLEEFEKLPEDVLDRSCVIMLTSSTSYMDMEKSRSYKTVKQFLSKPLTEEKVNRLKHYCEKKTVPAEK